MFKWRCQDLLESRKRILKTKYLINETSNIVCYTIELPHRKCFALRTLLLAKLESRN